MLIVLEHDHENCFNLFFERVSIKIYDCYHMLYNDKPMKHHNSSVDQTFFSIDDTCTAVQQYLFYLTSFCQAITLTALLN